MHSILIAHRGNLNGINHEKENSPDYLKYALSLGFDVETDVWFIDGRWFLGHDQPQHLLANPKELFENPHVWCHCKNFEALCNLRLMNNVHCFWHQEDDYTLTSQGIIWAYPGKNINQDQSDVIFSAKTVCVMPERCFDRYSVEDFQNCYGICTDEILQFSKIIQ